MKKLITILSIVTLVFLFILPNLVFGQISITKGIKAGLNMATIVGDDVDNYGSLSTKTGFSVGGFVVLNVAGMIGIRPEILYTMKGTSYEVEILGNKFEGSLKLDYLEIPVLLVYNLPLPGPVSPGIFAGPALGIKLSAKSETDGTEEDVEDVKSSDLGLVIGAGVTLNDMLTIDARFTMGLSSIDDSDAELDAKNQVISLMVGYCF